MIQKIIDWLKAAFSFKTSLSFQPMSIGMKGPEVRDAMLKLQKLGFYQGAIAPDDETFGPKMLAAVKLAQTRAGYLSKSGIIDQELMAWIDKEVSELDNGERPPDEPTAPVTTMSKIKMALSVTGKFEGKGYGQVTGDFDQQGISLGILQWNFGQGSLQSRILAPYLKAYGSIDKLGFFPMSVDHLATASIAAALTFCRQHMLSGTAVKATWSTAWGKFLKLPAVIDIQEQAAASVGDRAEAITKDIGFTSLKAFCWAFDIVTQNGSLDGVKALSSDRSAAKAELNGMVLTGVGITDFTKNKTVWLKKLDTCPAEDVVLLRTSIARAKKSRTEYRLDVLNRKGSIAMGGGWVHGGLHTFKFEEPVATVPEAPRTSTKWMDVVAGEMGQKEIPGANDNPRIVAYHKTTSLKASDDETPWCSSFVNWVFTQIGYKCTNSAAAISWTNWGIRITTPRYGCVAVRSRTGGNHVGFWIKDETRNGVSGYICRGGNQSNTVNDTWYPNEGLRGYFWPTEETVAS